MSRRAGPSAEVAHDLMRLPPWRIRVTVASPTVLGPMARKPTSPKHDRQTAFLEALETGVSIRAATKLAGVGCSTVFEWRKADLDFAVDWEAAYASGTDLLVAEAHRRAVNGVVTKVYFDGGQRVEIRKYSDLLLIFLLKARDPARYDDRVRLLNYAANLARREAENGKDDPAVREAALAAVAALERLANAKAATASTLH